MRIGIYGGTFNPPHKAHLRLARAFLKEQSLDRIIIIPGFIPPHKKAEDLSDSNDRLNMCRALFKDSQFIVSDIEIKREGKSYTVETLRELKKQYPRDELFLIIGSDMLLCFHRWYCFEEILGYCTLCVLSRENDIDREKMLAYSKEHLGLKENEIVISSLSPMVLSSTMIREKIKNGESTREYLTSEVIEYIRERGLYGEKI